jgi:serine O-acetyltransferase
MIIDLHRRPGRPRGLVETLKDDAKRYEDPWKDPAFWTMAVYRYGRWAMDLESPRLRAAASKLYGGLRLGVEVVFHNTVHREARIGEEFTLLHGGSVRIHPASVIGDRVSIMHEVTLGANTVQRAVKGAPTIGNDVFIGAGAKILGPVKVGDGAVIAANSLVLTDVPAGATAAGVPARILRFNGREEAS